MPTQKAVNEAQKLVGLYQACEAGHPAAVAAVKAIAQGAAAGDPDAQSLKAALDRVHTNTALGSVGARGHGLPTMHRAGMTFGAKGPSLTPDQITALIGLMNAAIASGSTSMGNPMGNLFAPSLANVFNVANVRATKAANVSQIAQQAAATARAVAQVQRTVQNPTIRNASLASLLR